MKQPPVVLGIAGSPRRHGNSDRLLDAALEGAREAGADVRRLVASEAELQPCRGCNSCSLTGACVLRDGGPRLYAAIDGADAIIVSSPVFFATVPAVLKIVYDRMQPYWARRYVLGQQLERRRPGGILLARSGGDPYGFTAAEATTRSVFAVLGIDVVGTVEAEGVDRRADLDARPEVLERARELGRAVADAAR
jgi:multimeric flavodoxin WrbA